MPTNTLRILWISFLVVWAASQLVYGAVAPWAVAGTATLLALLTLYAFWKLPAALCISRETCLFLIACAVLFLLQFLPLGSLLFRTTHAMREAHGVGGLWPGTADTFLTLRVVTQFSSYVLAALLVLALRQNGLSTHAILAGFCTVLGLHALYALVAYFAGWTWIPFYGARASLDDFTGTLVNRNHFAGLMAMGVVAATGLALHQFRLSWKRGLQWALLAALFTVCIIASKSRGGAIAALTGVSLLPFFHRGRLGGLGLATVALLGGAAVLIAHPGALLKRFETIDPYELSAETRWQYSLRTLAASAHQPVLGFGIGTHPRAFHPFQPADVAEQLDHPHNEYVALLFEGGGAWFLILLGGLILWMVRAFRSLHGPDRLLRTAAIAGVSGIVLHSLVDFELRITSVGILFASLIALGPSAFSLLPPLRRWSASIPPIVTLAGAAALALLPLNPEPYVRKAMAEPPEQAEKTCLKALGLSPFDHQAAWIAARAAYQRGDVTLADHRCAKAADLWPAHPDLQQDAGLYFWGRYLESGETNHRDRAARSFHRLFEQRHEAVTSILEEIWDRERPLSDFEALLPEKPEAWAMFAAFLVQQGNWQEGVTLFEKRCMKSVLALDLFASSLEAIGQWGLETTMRERRLELKSDAACYAACAQAWGRLSALDRALERAATAIRLDPGTAAWHAVRGALLHQKGEVAAAIEEFTEAIHLAPNDIAYRLRRGNLYLSLRLFEPAAEDFLFVTRLHASHREAIFGRVRALEGLGDRAAAQNVLKEYLVDVPTDEEARAFLKNLSP